MSDLVVLRATTEEPLKVFQQNLSSFLGFTEKVREFHESVGHEPVIIHHLEGSLCIGLHPLPNAPLEPAPEGWFADGPRRLLIPDRTSEKGNYLGRLIDSLYWDWKPIPGLECWKPRLGEEQWPVLNFDTLVRHDVMVEEGLAQAGDALWASIPRACANWALESGMWARARRSGLVHVLSQAGRSIWPLAVGS